jgi:hypothetical protein
MTKMNQDEKQGFGLKTYATTDLRPAHHAKRLSNSELRRQLGWELLQMNRDLNEANLKPATWVNDDRLN